MRKIRVLKKMKAKRLAAELVVSWIGEAWHDLDCPYYAKMPARCLLFTIKSSFYAQKERPTVEGRSD